MEVFMFLFVLYLILGAAAAVLAGVFAVSSPAQLWIPVLVFVGFNLAAWALQVLFVSVASLFADVKNGPKTMDNFFRRISLDALGTYLAVVGCRFTVENREMIPEEPCLLVCNHLSIIDPLALMVVLRKYKVAFIAKKEIKKIPVISRCMVPSGCLFLDRDDSRSAIYTIRDAAAFISDGIGSMGIFPEGTRNRSDKPVLPFHAGSFKIATKAGCPLVIVGISGTEKLSKNFPFRRTPITIRVLETIPSDEVASAKSTDLAAHAEKTIGDWVMSLTN